MQYRSEGHCVPIIRPKSFIGPERLGVFALLYDWATDGHNFPLPCPGILGTLLTVAAAKVDMGALNNVVMLLIACTKATLVILFFMHVRWGSRLTWVVAMAGFFWLLLLFTVLGDYISRGWVPGTMR